MAWIVAEQRDLFTKSLDSPLEKLVGTRNFTPFLLTMPLLIVINRTNKTIRSQGRLSSCFPFVIRLIRQHTFYRCDKTQDATELKFTNKFEVCENERYS